MRSVTDGGAPRHQTAQHDGIRAARCPGLCCLDVRHDCSTTLVSVDVGRVVLHSWRGKSPAAAFPEIESGSSRLPDATTLHGEMVFRAQGRLASSGSGTGCTAEELTPPELPIHGWPISVYASDQARVVSTQDYGINPALALAVVPQRAHGSSAHPGWWARSVPRGRARRPPAGCPTAPSSTPRSCPTCSAARTSTSSSTPSLGSPGPRAWTCWHRQAVACGPERQQRLGPGHRRQPQEPSPDHGVLHHALASCEVSNGESAAQPQRTGAGNQGNDHRASPRAATLIRSPSIAVSGGTNVASSASDDAPCSNTLLTTACSAEAASRVCRSASASSAPPGAGSAYAVFPVAAS